MVISSSLAKKLKELDVTALYLFGSRAQGNESPLSDYDYAVLTQMDHSKGDPLYFKLYDLLSEISPRTQENDVIDIVFLKNATLELRFHVIRYGKILFETDRNKRLNFEAQSVLLYCDYRPLLDGFDEQIVNSL